MRLGIDCTNIRGGGGLTILLEFLRLYQAGDYGCSEIKIWCNSDVAKSVRLVNSAVDIQTPTALQSNGLKRFAWRLLKFPKLVRKSVDVLFIPGGLPVVSGVRNVSMSLNLLPFAPEEYRRDFSIKQEVVYGILRYLNYNSLAKSDTAIFLNQNAHKVIYGGRNAEQHIAICQLGVDESFFSKKVNANFSQNFCAETPFKLIYVSTINGYKHQWNVVDAVSKLRDRGLSLEVDFVGGAANSKALKRLQTAISNAGINAPYTRYLGKIAHSQLHETYRAANGFVFASTCENMPNICLEAMASGLPFASSDREPMKTMLDGCALFFDATDSSSIAAAIERLYQDPKLRENLSKNATKMARSYSWQRFYSDCMIAIASKQ